MQGNKSINQMSAKRQNKKTHKNICSIKDTIKRKDNSKTRKTCQITYLINNLYQEYIENSQNSVRGDFPGGTVVKNLPANAGNMGSIPGPGRSHMQWSN